MKDLGKELASPRVRLSSLMPSLRSCFVEALNCPNLVLRDLQVVFTELVVFLAACRRGDLATVKHLHAEGASPDAIDHDR